MDYRKRALKILPWVCTRCAREFTGKNLRQLTVHHKDHDHTNNPPDGSNWELLCVYCHDDEHSRNETAAAYGSPSTGRRSERGSFKALEGLGEMLGGEAPMDGEEPAAASRNTDGAGPDEAPTRGETDGGGLDEAPTRGETDGGAPDEPAGEEASRAAEQPEDRGKPAQRNFWGDEG